MKKVLLTVCLLAVALATVFVPSSLAFAAADIEPKTTAKSAYLVDYDSGKVLYERNADEKLPIASMVKIMTLKLTFDKIAAGELSMDDMITISDEAAGMGGSQMFLDAGKEYSVRDLIKGVTVASANDAATALAETVAGSIDAFVNLMNETAKKSGMNDTVFVNVTGLPGDGQYSTARDVSTMTRELLKHKEYYNFSKIYMEDYKHPDGRVTELVNTNKLVRFYKGCDAGKTGFTNAAMFCLSASAERTGTRVVATVMGAPDSKSRFNEVSTLFNYAFANYKRNVIVDKNSEIESDIVVKGGKDKHLVLNADRDIAILEKRGETGEYTVDINVESAVKAPIKAGDKVGTISVKDKSGNEIGSANIISATNVDLMSYGDALKDILRNWLYGKK